MKIVDLTMSQALELSAREPYAYITRLSCVEVGRNPKDFSMDELLEARFFGPQREIRIYRQDDCCQTVMLEEEEGDVFLERVSQLREPEFGHLLTVRQYIEYDADGQGNIQSIRLVDWEGHAYERDE